MKRLSRVLALGLALFALTFGLACGSGEDETSVVSSSDPRADWPRVFRLGLFGGDDAEETLRNAAPMKKLLETQLGEVGIDLKTDNKTEEGEESEDGEGGDSGDLDDMDEDYGDDDEDEDDDEDDDEERDKDDEG